MKKYTFLLFLLLIVLQPTVLAQKSGKNNQIIYTFGVNEVPNGSNIPLIGLVNTAHGDQKSVHIGLINTNTGSLSGAQIGFINTVANDMNGLQVAFVNTTGDKQKGFQAGFINTIGDRMQGVQAGFINTVRKMEGFQIGFINATETLNGFQIGFINAAARTKGAQIGFINSCQILTGLQLGFINTVETAAHGFPIGFLSFVRHGGFQAFELSFNEMYPYNASIKIGMDKFYTFPIVSYNPDFVNPYAFGFGAGSNIHMNEEVFFNPELISQTVISNDMVQMYSLGLNFGHSFTDQLDFLAGPSVVLNKRASNEPLYTIYNRDVDGLGRIQVGFRLALRYRL